MEIFKILGVVFIGSILAILSKDKRNEFSLIIIIVCSCVVLTFMVKEIVAPISVLAQKIENYGINNSYFKTALKALAIGYIASFVADSCRDAGQSALAHGAELAGKCAIFILSLPLVLNILEAAVGLVK